MTELPAVSVIVPTFNRPNELRRLLTALARQEGASFEVVIVDDGGVDPVDGLCREFATSLPLRLIHQDNAGPAAARNRGAAEARAPILAFTDDDCIPCPKWVSVMAAACGFDEPLLVGGRTINAIARSLFSAASQDVAEYLMTVSDGEFPFAASNNIAMPRSAFGAVGGFDTSYPLAAGEDRAFCRQWGEMGWTFVRAPEAVVEHCHRLGP